MVEIRQALESDEDLVKDLYLKLLSDVAPFGMDVVPSSANADAYWNGMLLPAIRDNSGVVLVAENSVPIGGLFWPVVPTGLETTEKSATGLGVYVEPRYRNSGVATNLRNRAFSILNQQGIESVLGFVHVGNIAGIASAMKAGAEVVGTVVKFPTSQNE